MRLEHIKPVITVENFIDLSLEEEALIESTIGEDTQNIINEEENIQRAEDTTNAVEDMLIIGKSPNMDGPATALMESVGEMTLAGSDVEADELIPLGSDNAMTFSMEDIQSIKDRLKAIWDAIVRALERMWGYILSIFKNYSMLLNSYKKKIALLKLDITKKRSEMTELDNKAVITISNVNRGISIIRTGKDVLDGLMILDHVGKDAIGPGAKNNVEVGELIVHLLTQATAAVKSPTILSAKYVSEDELNKAISEFTLLASVKAYNASTQMTGATKIAPGEKSKTYDFGQGLPGGKQFVVEYTAHDSKFDDGDPAVYLEQFLNTKIALIDDPKFTDKSKKPSEILVPTLNELMTIADESISILIFAIEYSNKTATMLDKVQRDMRDATKKLVDSVTDKTSSDKIKLLLQLNTHYGSLIKNVGGPMLGIVKQQMSAMESLISKSLSQYKEVKVR